MANTATLADAKPKRRTNPVSQYTQLVGKRKRVTIPVTPFNSLAGTGDTYAGTNCELEEVNSLDIVGINYAAANDLAHMHWFIPDDMDTDQPLWIRILYMTSTKGTTDSVVYTMKHVANTIKDHSAAAVGAIVSITTAAFDTAWTDTIDLIDLTQSAIYRGSKGIVAGGTYEQDGICTLEIKSTTVESGSICDVVAVEYWYVQRKL